MLNVDLRHYLYVPKTKGLQLLCSQNHFDNCASVLKNGPTKHLTAQTQWAYFLLGLIMKKHLLFVFASISLAFPTRADLIAAWDFQTIATGGTSITNAPNTPRVINANFGSGTIYLDGSNGSSSWVTNTTGNELTAFGGSTVNTSNGLSSVTTGSSGLALVNTNANGKYVTLGFSMTGFQGLSLTYTTQRTSTGFTNQLWEFSTDGSNWSLVGNVGTGTVSGTIATAYNTSGVIGFYGITGLDNASTAYLRLTVSGASAAAGNNRLDNIQLNATVVPEPATFSLMLFGVLGLRRFMGRQKSSS